jgi:hypothetical protein
VLPPTSESVRGSAASVTSTVRGVDAPLARSEGSARGRPAAAAPGRPSGRAQPASRRAAIAQAGMRRRFTGWRLSRAAHGALGSILSLSNGLRTGWLLGRWPARAPRASAKRLAAVANGPLLPNGPPETTPDGPSGDRPAGGPHPKGFCQNRLPYWGYRCNQTTQIRKPLLAAKLRRRASKEWLDALRFSMLLCIYLKESIPVPLSCERRLLCPP